MIVDVVKPNIFLYCGELTGAAGFWVFILIIPSIGQYTGDNREPDAIPLLLLGTFVAHSKIFFAILTLFIPKVWETSKDEHFRSRLS